MALIYITPEVEEATDEVLLAVYDAMELSGVKYYMRLSKEPGNPPIVRESGLTNAIEGTREQMTATPEEIAAREIFREFHRSEVRTNYLKLHDAPLWHTHFALSIGLNCGRQICANVYTDGMPEKHFFLESRLDTLPLEETDVLFRYQAVYFHLNMKVMLNLRNVFREVYGHSDFTVRLDDCWNNPLTLREEFSPEIDVASIKLRPPEDDPDTSYYGVTPVFS